MKRKGRKHKPLSALWGESISYFSSELVISDRTFLKQEIWLFKPGKPFSLERLENVHIYAALCQI